MIILIRHGRTLGNIDQQFVGVTDLPLSPVGIADLNDYKSVNSYPVCSKVYSSPLQRCVQTANTLFENCDPIIVDKLIEMNFGDYEGLNFKQIISIKGNEDWGMTAESMIFPNGEDRDIFRCRIIEAFESIISENLNNFEKLDKKIDGFPPNLAAVKKTAGYNIDAVDLDENNIAIVCHGGVIMFLMEYLFGEDYPVWYVKCGNGFMLDFKSYDNSYAISNWDYLFDNRTMD